MEKSRLTSREKPLEFTTHEGEPLLHPPTIVTSGGWEQKCWGSTRRVFQSDSVSLHQLILDVPHSFCSIHYHTNRDNRFTVVAGSIRVVVRMGGQDHLYVVGEGETLFVPAGSVHQFQVSTTQSLIWECYTSSDRSLPVDDGDIVRQHEGGVCGQPVSPGSLFLVKK